MTTETQSLRRIFVGREVGLVFSILLAGSLLISGGFVPGYLAVLLASGLRNVYLGWLGSGILFYAVALVFLYLEAVALTMAYVGLRYVYESIQNQPERNASA